MIPVTKPFLPPVDEYEKLISNIWSNNILTNNGPYVTKLESKLEAFLEVEHLQFVTNGTLALQLAIQALELTGEIITTPFSFVATTNSILWESCEPIFVDICSDTLTIDPNKIESAISSKTTAILATHVYGIPCDVHAIQKIADKYNLKVIYDAAHAFNVKFKGESVLNYGDISILSFHATKLYHTVEGGALIYKDEKLGKRIKELKNFGFTNINHPGYGINAKGSEFHAAMGLCNLKYIDSIISEREAITNYYNKHLIDKILRPKISQNVLYNYSYYPIIFKDESQLMKVSDALEQKSIYGRRYFYPSLNKLNFLTKNNSCPTSEDISERIFCLPLFNGLKKEDLELIVKVIRENL